MGIVLVEQQLQDILSNDDEEFKKKKGMRILKSWHQLASLYKALGEEDVIMGIYRQIATVPETKEAIEHEMEGDFFEAFRVYHQAVQQLDEKKFEKVPSSYETDIWENGRLECMAKLGRWAGLAENTLHQVDNDPNLLLSPEVPCSLLLPSPRLPLRTWTPTWATSFAA